MPARCPWRSWGFWVHAAYFDSSQTHNLTMVSDSDGALTTTVQDVWHGQQLGVQFG